MKRSSFEWFRKDLDFFQRSHGSMFFIVLRRDWEVLEGPNNKSIDLSLSPLITLGAVAFLYASRA